MQPYFQFYSKQQVLSHTRIRRFETKTGEMVAVLPPGDTLEQRLLQCDAEYVLFGVCEDIGVKANYGTGGTSSCWPAFLDAFLNTQSNDFMKGEELLVLGHFDFREMDELIEANALSADERIEAYRHAVNTIDQCVEELVKLICQCEKIPVVIGGGHNNAYPCIKGAAKGLHKAGMLEIAQINALNLDAHADYRPMEGRHSGNGFRYAEEDGYLERYCVIGLHENYLTQNMWIDLVNNPFMDVITLEDIFVHQKQSFRQAVDHGIGFTSDTYCGLEIDLDCIEDTLSSAASPVGFSPLHVRQFIKRAAAQARVAYLHICEGATALADGRRNDLTGKLVSYLVSDFVKSRSGADNRREE